jgi:hypothetical protein
VGVELFGFPEMAGQHEIWPVAFKLFVLEGFFYYVEESRQKWRFCQGHLNHRLTEFPHLKFAAMVFGHDLVDRQFGDPSQYFIRNSLLKHFRNKEPKIAMFLITPIILILLTLLQSPTMKPSQKPPSLPINSHRRHPSIIFCQQSNRVFLDKQFGLFIDPIKK